MKNLLTSTIMVGDKKTAEIGCITGKVTKKGVVSGTTKSGNPYARISLSVGTTDYDVKHTEYVLKLKDAHLTRNGDKADKYPLLFVDAVAYGKTAEQIAKNVKAGETVRVIGTIATNEFKDTLSLSVTVTDFEKDFNAKAEDAEVEVEVASDDMEEVDW